MDAVKPTDVVVSTKPKISSRTIVDAFLMSELTTAEIDIEATGRDKGTVYGSLHAYIKRHPSLNVAIKMVDGKIILWKYEASQ